MSLGRDGLRIVLVGAAGQMFRVTARSLARALPGATLVLADRDGPALAALRRELANPRAEAVVIDVGDRAALARLVGEANLVASGVGPFFRMAPPVRQACLEARVDYVDIDDDAESVLAAAALDTRAREAGVRLMVGCGAGPGLSNVLARDAVSRLEEAETVEVGWVVGDEGATDYGRAAIEHALRLGAGPCATWREGRMAEVEAFRATRVFPLGGWTGDNRLYETPHPEPVMLGRSYPRLRDIRCWGGLDPQPLNGALRGVALAHLNGRLDDDEACDFMREIAADRFGSFEGWRAALAGIAGQVRRGEVGLGETSAFLANALTGRHGACRAGFAALATGRAGGRRLEVIRSTAAIPFWRSMATYTGECAAAFITLALEGPPTPNGVLYPEAWVEPATFYDRLRAVAGLSESPVEAPRSRELP